MIKDLKLGMKIMGYGHGWKRSYAAYALLTVWGVLMLVLEERMGRTGFFVMCGSMFPVQAIYTLSLSNMLQASPAKKRLQTSVPAIINSCHMMIAYLIAVVVCRIIAAAHPEKSYVMYNELFSMALMGVVLMVYSVIVYKYFLISVILFIGVYFGMVSFIPYGDFFGWFAFLSQGSLPMPFLWILVIGWAILSVGGFLEYLVSLLIYKAPMSKYAQSATLRREL